jgi:hypothetical protein
MIVEDVVRRRGALVRDTPIETDRGGRLLLSWGCNYSLGSGEAAALSRGFFDEYDVPPWDFWLAYETPTGKQPYPGQALVAWVPTALIEVADAGIKAAAGDTIVWLEPDHSDPSQLPVR